MDLMADQRKNAEACTFNCTAGKIIRRGQRPVKTIEKRGIIFK